ncbi:MAG: DUF4920 domain-containing protein [Flavobacteriaceae bacterium]|nr:DUF4920 domain-containing protein [Flavobacteriaceae bacterium]
MKNKIIAFVLLLSVVACKETNKETQEPRSISEISYASFGKKITNKNSISREEMAKKFNLLNMGDTINVKFTSIINEVCKKKGCWMKLDLGDEKESMVRFTDYSFLMPLNSDNREVIVEGRAFISEISVDELRHYAEDAGKTKDEIAMITEPKITLSIEADGVLMIK